MLKYNTRTLKLFNLKEKELLYKKYSKMEDKNKDTSKNNTKTKYNYSLGIVI